MTPGDTLDRDRLLETFLDLVAVDSPSGHGQVIGDMVTACQSMVAIVTGPK